MCLSRSCPECTLHCRVSVHLILLAVRSSAPAVWHVHAGGWYNHHGVQVLALAAAQGSWKSCAVKVALGRCNLLVKQQNV
jgi:hypothetical protein